MENMYKSTEDTASLVISAAFLSTITIFSMAPLSNSSPLIATSPQQGDVSPVQSLQSDQPVTKSGGLEPPPSFLQDTSNSSLTNSTPSGLASNGVANSLLSSSSATELTLIADELKIMAERNRLMADQLDGLASTMTADELKIMAERNRLMADQLDGLAGQIETMANLTNTT
jgi:hypothetical protein